MLPEWIENTMYFFAGVAAVLLPMLIGTVLGALDAMALRAERLEREG